MKILNSLYSLPLLVAAPFAMAQSGHDAHTHGHDTQAAAVAEKVPAAAKRWAVDVPLQTGMGKIRTAVESLAHHEMGHLDTKQVVMLATEIDTQVQYLIANCKLDPAADNALHGIIGPLLAGAKALKDKPADAAPVAALRSVLHDYPRYFDDPTWLPLAD